MCSLENILSSLPNFTKEVSEDWNSNIIFSKFKDHVLHTEKRLRIRLEGLKYYIDDSNALPVVTGTMPGKPEMVRLQRS